MTCPCSLTFGPPPPDWAEADRKGREAAERFVAEHPELFPPAVVTHRIVEVTE